MFPLHAPNTLNSGVQRAAPVAKSLLVVQIYLNVWNS